MKNIQTKSKHRSKWKYIIVKDDEKQVKIELNESGKILAPFRKEKYRNLSKYVLQQGYTFRRESNLCNQLYQYQTILNLSLLNELNENVLESNLYDDFKDFILDLTLFDELDIS